MWLFVGTDFAWLNYIDKSFFVFSNEIYLVISSDRFAGG